MCFTLLTELILHWVYPLQKEKTTPPIQSQKNGMSQVWYWNCIQWYGFDSESLGNVEYPFIAIAPRYILAQIGSNCLVCFYGSNRFVLKLLILDSHKGIKYYNVLIICIKKSYSKL